MVALAPVYLATTEDTMEQVKDLGKVLSELENMDLIFLDYDIPIANYAYAEYKNSALYAYFVQTTEEAARRPNPAFDTPDLELGSITLTEKGENWVDEMLKGGK